MSANVRRSLASSKKLKINLLQALLNSTRADGSSSILPKDLAQRIKSFWTGGSMLGDDDRTDLQLRLDVVRAQVFRLLNKDAAWKGTRLVHLLQRIKHQTSMNRGYEVTIDLHGFKSLCVGCT